jgi:rhomboid protease GluP
MDWSLALLSQGIDSTILHDPSLGWYLTVHPLNSSKAELVILTYRHENQPWIWRHPWHSSTLLFHWGAAGWCLILAFLNAWSHTGGPALRQLGIMNNDAVLSGEWWRLFTATTLHANLAHLATNLCFGFVLLGLAMARWGAGPALLASWSAGAVGNLAALSLYPPDHQGLGASGIVMGALGLLAIAPWHHHHPAPLNLTNVTRGIAAGILLFVLLGLNPASDTIAHLGGFIGGLLFGFILAQLPNHLHHHPRFSLLCAITAALSLISSWTFALHN